MFGECGLAQVPCCKGVTPMPISAPLTREICSYGLHAIKSGKEYIFCHTSSDCDSGNCSGLSAAPIPASYGTDNQIDTVVCPKDFFAYSVPINAYDGPCMSLAESATTGFSVSINALSRNTWRIGFPENITWSLSGNPLDSSVFIDICVGAKRKSCFTNSSNYISSVSSSLLSRAVRFTPSSPGWPIRNDYYAQLYLSLNSQFESDYFAVALPRPSISVKTPLSPWIVGSVVLATWTATDFTSTDPTLMRLSVCNTSCIELTSSRPANRVVDGQGLYNLPPSIVPGAYYLKCHGDRFNDSFSGNFTISQITVPQTSANGTNSSSVPQTLSLNVSATWRIPQVQIITWSFSGFDSSSTIYVDICYGAKVNFCSSVAIGSFIDGKSLSVLQGQTSFTPRRGSWPTRSDYYVQAMIIGLSNTQLTINSNYFSVIYDPLLVPQSPSRWLPGTNQTLYWNALDFDNEFNVLNVSACPFPDSSGGCVPLVNQQQVRATQLTGSFFLPFTARPGNYSLVFWGYEGNRQYSGVFEIGQPFTTPSPTATATTPTTSTSEPTGSVSVTFSSAWAVNEPQIVSWSFANLTAASSVFVQVCYGERKFNCGLENQSVANIETTVGAGRLSIFPVRGSWPLRNDYYIQLLAFQSVSDLDKHQSNHGNFEIIERTSISTAIPTLTPTPSPTVLFANGTKPNTTGPSPTTTPASSASSLLVTDEVLSNVLTVLYGTLLYLML